MKGKVGDTILAESEKVAQPPRKGVIEAVLAEEPPRFRVRWEDGRTTIFTPSGGSAVVKPAKRAKAKTRA